uniref:Uncharacterized protein n=1 Tax=Acrobeloides nanus TaxID=290746 RepID=A0A914C6C7_9BILA
MMAKARLFGMDSTDQRQLNDDEYTDQDYSQNLDQTSTEDLEQAEYETPPENQRSIGLDGWLSYWARENIIKQLIDKRNEPAPPYPDRSPKSRRKEHANTTQSPSPNLDENSTLATPSEEPTQPTITTTPSEEPTQPTITTTPSEGPTQPTITTTPRFQYEKFS